MALALSVSTHHDLRSVFERVFTAVKPLQFLARHARNLKKMLAISCA
jgi:hypothetical protein